MKKDKILKDKKFLKEIAIILIVGIIINAFCFMLPLVVHAAGETTTTLPLPIGVPTGLNIPESKVDYVKTAYINYLASNYSHDVSTTYTIFVDQIVDQGTPNETIYIVATSGFYVDLSNWNTSLSYQNSQQHYCQFTYYPVSDTILGPTFYGGWVNTWTYSPADLANYKGWVLDNYDGDISSGSTLVWTTSYSPNPNEFTPSPLVPTPSDNPKPTAPVITPPNIDSSLSLIENIKNLFQWLGETIKSVIKWAIDSIGTFFDNLKNFLKDIINAVISAINNGFNNVFLNFKNLISPFFSFFTGFAQGIDDFIDAFTDPNTGFIAFIKTAITNMRTNIASLVDAVISIYNFLLGTDGFFDTYGVIWNQETWDDALDDSPWLDAVSDNTTTMSQFINGTLNVAEPQELTFTMDFRNAYYNFGLVTWDLSWYQPYKQPVRLAFLSICVLNALVYFFDEAPNFFSGGGSNKKGDK